MKLALSIIFMLLVSSPFAQEICNNGIDDDADGLIDLQDTVDCSSCLLAISDTSFTSLVPNPSFENRSCCPTGPAATNCVNNWMAASYATPDYLNTICSYTQIGANPGPGTPLPNGSGYVGIFTSKFMASDYREYIGTCIPTPLFAGVNYQLEFYLTTDTIQGFTQTEFAIYGTPLCSNLPVITSPAPFTECLSKSSSAGYSWTNLATTNTPTNRNWTLITLNFTPSTNINAVAFGATCIDTNMTRYQYIDDIKLNKTIYFNAKRAKIIDTGNLCKGDLLLTALYNKQPKSFQWYKDSIALVGDTNATYNVPINGAGSYQVILQYDSNCIITKSFVVDAPIFPQANFYSDSVCLGLRTSFYDNSTISSGSIVKWDWSLGNTPSLSSNSIIFPSAGVHPVTLEVTSNVGCKKDTTINSIVHPLPKIDFNFSPLYINLFNTDICFNNLSVGASSFLWDFDFAGASGISNLVSPCTVSFPDKNAKNYSVTLIGTSNNGCIDSITKTISIIDDFIVYIPNSFTPNGDDQNDKLNIVLGGVKSYEFIIFNRWGEKIFFTTDLTKFWDGTHHGKNAGVGTYVYKITVNTKNGQTKELIGHVNLIR